MLLVGFNLMLKLTFLSIYGRMIVPIVCALFIGLVWETAAGQSKTQIADWLQTPELMLDMAVILTVDVFTQVAFCILEARFISDERLTKFENLSRLVTLWLPGILIFPTLFALLVEIIFSTPGMDFAGIAWILAVTVLATGISLPFLIKRVIPETNLRLELIFMVNAMIALLGIVASVNGQTAVTGTNHIEWQALFGVGALLLLSAIAGFFIFKRKNNIKLPHIK